MAAHSIPFKDQSFFDTYNNVHFLHADFQTICDGTPAEDIWPKIVETSLHPLAQTSDVARLAILWKFGGTYLDTDTITLRHFPENVSNFMGATPYSHIGNL